jgi:hypothetical protein
MANENSFHTEDSPGGDKWAWIVILIIVLGFPLLGVLAKLLGY